MSEYCLVVWKKNHTHWKDLKMRTETVKLLKENIRKNLLDTGLGNDFLDTTPKAQAAKAKINKWDYIKLKSFCTAKKIKSNQQNEMATYRKGKNICKLFI